ncbi:MAG: hypothetical protein LBI67_01780 [Treponema sp.]|nr:hypothetical protein [Treponema sp.]
MGVLRILAVPVSFFYFLFSKRSRTESKRFLQKVSVFIKDGKTAKKCVSCFGPLRVIVSFSLCLLERLESWNGTFPFSAVHFKGDGPGDLVRGLENGKGAFIICSHLGNTELLRALASFNKTGVSRNIRVTSIVDFSVTSRFNRMLWELNPQSRLSVIGADEIGPHTAPLLEERLAGGELVVIAGDRTPAAGDKAPYDFPFLGEHAPFAFGSFYLASLLNYPVYFVFALRHDGGLFKKDYDMYIHKSGVSFDCPRSERLKRSEKLARLFALTLESHCKKYPFQWYNFHDFWADKTCGPETAGGF